MGDLVSLEREGDVAVITIRNPPVNALSPGVAEGIGRAVEEAAQDPAIRAIVLIGAGRTFIAGADIKELSKLASGASTREVGLNPLLAAIEGCPKPVVAAIHGTAFGGGLELAMACHCSVAVPSAKVGQPEVKLGLIPGAGGTQRLPRLAGVAKAAEMCASGEPVSAPEALRLGILDRIVEGDLRAEAITFARGKAEAGGPPRKTCDLSEKLGDPEANAPVFDAIRKVVGARARGMIAPLLALDAVEAAASLPFEEGLRREAELFGECLRSDPSKALIHVFFGEREAAKVPGLAKDTPRIPIARAAVVGAGTMGSGIATAYLNAGLPVLLKEATPEALERGVDRIRKTFASAVSKGKLDQAEMDRRLGLLRPTLDYDGFRDVDIAVEAVFEDMALKMRTFAELDAATRPNTILATNTSTLDIDAIASATSRPERVIGHHFFSPANVMRLLEVVRGEATGDDVIATSMDLAKTLGKVGVLVGNCMGFVGNRMFIPFLREAQFLLEEGATVEGVDAALVEFGMAMGPHAVADLAGLDVGWRIRREHGRLEPEGTRTPLVADRLCEMGRFGQKTGAGWYRYEAGNRTPIPDPDAERLIRSLASEAGIPQRTITPREIVERTVFAIVNEGARILEEGIALRASDIDIIYIHGYGFPAFRGGPMWYADTIGLKAVCDRIRAFEREHGEPWAPAPLLVRLADEGGSFAGWDRARPASA